MCIRKFYAEDGVKNHMQLSDPHHIHLSGSRISVAILELIVKVSNLTSESEFMSSYHLSHKFLPPLKKE